MSSPSMVQRSGDTLIIRSVVSGNRLFVDGSESGDNGDMDAESDDAFMRKNESPQAGFDLPECKVKRNYMCNDCKFFTNNPRQYLNHLRDIHNEKFRSYECPHCLYASKRGKSLLRHLKVSHENIYTSETTLTSSKPFISEDNTEDKEMEDFENEDLEFSGPIDTANRRYPCSVCSYAGKSIYELASHERKDHNSNKYFPCSMCTYVTHIKARFTKHVKYHSMPTIKCSLCDFATPYKWNLDRHMKNHGGTGSFGCAMCNFTADIKQSLTVHEMNHHTPPVGHGSNALRRKNKSTHNSYRKQSMVMATDQDPEFDKSGNGELATLQMLTHGTCSGLEENDKSKHSLYKKCNKIPRPIPNLIPLQPISLIEDIDFEPPMKKKLMSYKHDPSTIKSEANIQSDRELSVEVSPQFLSTNLKKKNESFFDKLQERLLTATAENESLICKICGFLSKCLSEYSVHEKNCHVLPNKSVATASTIRSTRCQNCRHRCKSSADLIIHMQNCSSQNGKETATEDIISHETNNNSKEIVIPQNPHPMENVVFVWNPMSLNANETNYERNNVKCPNEIYEATDLSAKSCDLETSSQSELMAEDMSNSSAGKKAFQCPHCSFWASTASRFHVHIVGHLNRKPFECSLCPYRSNWRWDITKHIRLKSIRDPEHASAKVLMTDETGRRNYSKYNKYLRLIHTDEQQPEDTINANSHKDADDNEEQLQQPSNNPPSNTPKEFSALSHKKYSKKTRRTMWKCKKCNYRNRSKEELLAHVRVHGRAVLEVVENRPKAENSSSIAFRCGHCNQLSNWKHVIQRHCRLKHDGNINVVQVDKPSITQLSNAEELIEGKCTVCPFTSDMPSILEDHLQQHFSSPKSVFKCYFCPYFVNTENELIHHLPLHGIGDPEEYIAKTMNGVKAPISEKVPWKRYKCTECPYDSNSKSQFVYHKQFHKLSSNTPYKCQQCNYSVTKRHLLHQHMRVHRLSFLNSDANQSTMQISDSQNKVEDKVDAIPFVWVSAKNEFHKMYKCRYCSYVNAQKDKIPIHENVHIALLDDSIILYKCLDCKFTCGEKNNLVAHSKFHDEIYGRIHGPVDLTLSDEEQLQKISNLALVDKNNTVETSVPNNNKTNNGLFSEKMLHFCTYCPARFLSEQGWRVHARFHHMRLPYQCSLCSYTARQQAHLLSHKNVHSEDYQIKTKMLQGIHKTNSGCQQQNVVMVVSGMGGTEPVCIVVREDKAKAKEQRHETLNSNESHNINFGDILYTCSECPAKFSKLQALNNHKQYHNSNGEFKCKTCSYSVKTNIYLVKHERLHKFNNNSQNTSTVSPQKDNYENESKLNVEVILETTTDENTLEEATEKFIARPNDHFPPVLQADPQFGYLMHGNPNFIYPTYIKNGRQKEKRYKCHKCPSAFEKREQYKVHLSLHGSKQRYKCDVCDYSVKYYANYVQHMRKHQMNAEAQAAKKNTNDDTSITASPSLNDYRHQSPKPVSPNQISMVPQSLIDQQRDKILQRRLTVVSNLNGQNTEERKNHVCLYCPYTSPRKDALDNHIKRHILSSENNSHCPHCNFSIPQPHLLKEHIKIHFTPQKPFQPNGYFKVDNISLRVQRAVNYCYSNNHNDPAIHVSCNRPNNNIIDKNSVRTYILPHSGEVVEY